MAWALVLIYCELPHYQIDVRICVIMRVAVYSNAVHFPLIVNLLRGRLDRKSRATVACSIRHCVTIHIRTRDREDHRQGRKTMGHSPNSPPHRQGRLLDQVRWAIGRKHYSYRPELADLHWVKPFVLFHDNRRPPGVRESEIGAFFTHLAVRRGVLASTQSQAVNVLLFLYEHVLGKGTKGVLSPFDTLGTSWKRQLVYLRFAAQAC